VCALWLDNLIYKSFYTSFDLSQFTSDDDINMIIGDALDWFDIGQVGTDEELPDVPTTFSLNQNFPNPFAHSTTISFTLPAGNHNATINIYNLKGQLVRELIPVAPSSNLPVSVTWDGKDEKGNRVSPGIYFYKMDTGNYSQTKKMILLK